MAKDKNKNIDTEVLLTEIKESSSYYEFLDKNEDHLGVEKFKNILRKTAAETGKEINQIIKDAGIAIPYGYQIFNGTRKPSRDKIIQLSFGMSLPLDKVNVLLKHGEKQPLYAKSQRDSIIIYAISHQMEINEVNNMLIENNMITL